MNIVRGFAYHACDLNFSSNNFALKTQRNIEILVTFLSNKIYVHDECSIAIADPA